MEGGNQESVLFPWSCFLEWNLSRMDVSPEGGQPGVTLEKGGWEGSCLGVILWKGKDNYLQELVCIPQASPLFSAGKGPTRAVISTRGAVGSSLGKRGS